MQGRRVADWARGRQGSGKGFRLYSGHSRGPGRVHERNGLHEVPRGVHGQSEIEPAFPEPPGSTCMTLGQSGLSPPCRAGLCIAGASAKLKDSLVIDSQSGIWT